METQRHPVLTQEQIEFLKFAGNSELIKENYYLTGGTPLAAFYLHHRYSEDLDFFTEKEEVNIPAVEKFMHQAKAALSIQKIRYQRHQGLHMFFLEYQNKSELKVDFNYYPFPQIKKGGSEFGVLVDSLHDIAVNKVQTIATRTTARDFIDLYCIIKSTGFTLSQLIKEARIKFDWYVEPIQFGKQFLKAPKLEDLPRMISPIPALEWQNFFIEEAKKLSSEILSE